MAISLIARLFIVGYSHELIISFLIVSSLLITAMATDEKFRLAKNVLVFVCGLGSMFFLPSAVFTPAIILTGLYINKLSVVFPVIGLIRLCLDGDKNSGMFVLCLCILSVVLWGIVSRYEFYRKNYFELKDRLSTENTKLSNENRLLIQTKNDAVEIAVLTERNRIAREIHDKVGHMLTRAILQMGAIEIINKEESLKEPISTVKATLDDAMTSIRQSVHDLHDDSVNLKYGVNDCVKALPEKFNVRLAFDISENVSKEIKLSVLAILEECVNNIIKHSKGDEVAIEIYEYPEFCRMSVFDNGKNAVIKNSGIGLMNMKSRVQELSGTINITANEKGFKVFITIPKVKRS